MEVKTPARRQPGQGLDNDSHTINSNKNYPRLPIGVNRQRVLNQIANRWHGLGFYDSPSRAMEALLGDAL